MRGITTGSLVGIIVLCIAACSPESQSAAPTQNDVEPVKLTILKISPELSDGDERTNLSGAACAPSGQCLLAGDEKRFVRLFRLAGDTLVPGEPLFLLPDKDADGKEMKEADTEGIAYSDGYFYIVGSHSNSKKAKVQQSRHFVARIPLRPAGGFEDLGSAGKPSGGLVMKNLDHLINAEPAFQPYLKHAAGELKSGGAGFTEDQHGPNIEGVAVTGDTMWVGFRGPVDSGGAFLYEIKLSQLFGGVPPTRILHQLQLGSTPDGIGQGVRDLAAVRDGLLILAGPEMRSDPDPTPDQSVQCQRACPQPELFLWKMGQQPRRIADLGNRFKGDSPEAIVVLEETNDVYRILLLSDGMARSEPVLLEVRKRAS
ncbi:MAG TPA: DUF3616 domain-containing protein [Sphingomicrobium sp.]|nr:DUF3616 domain-containing protein [Sphingomicrobium sp.]